MCRPPCQSLFPGLCSWVLGLESGWEEVRSCEGFVNSDGPIAQGEMVLFLSTEVEEHLHLSSQFLFALVPNRSMTAAFQTGNFPG